MDFRWRRWGLSDNISLIKAAQRGDSEAFAALIELFQGKVYGLSYHLTGNYEDAQDLAQEAFIRAYRFIGSFRMESDFGTWLHRITVNTWINIKRKQNKLYTDSLDQTVRTDSGELKREVTSPFGIPDEEAETRELQQMVRSAILELSDEHRTVLVLREIYGYSYDEIAASTDASLGTVKSRLNRAKSSLREKLSRWIHNTE